MHKLLISLAVLFLGLLAWPVSAEPACVPVAADSCEIRKHPSCGPIDLFYWRGAGNTPRCARATVQLTQTEMMPQLRRIECLFYGDATRIAFRGENYVSTTGTELGETLTLRHGSLKVSLHGNYHSAEEPSWVAFENLGPGGSVIMKCSAYGPA